jgi:O-antigen/teichoic acid export membrane protein
MVIAERIKRLLPRNRFARSVSILAGGTAAGQGIIVLASPLLTRLYSPEDFGLLAVYAALLGIISVIASLRYQLAIPLPESDEEAAHIVVLSLLVVLGMTGLTVLAVVFFREPIAEALNAPALAGYLWLLPLGLLLAGIYQVFNYWAIRIKAFPAIARTKLTQSVSMVGMQLGGYMLGPLALLLGQISSQAAGTSSLGVLAIRVRWEIFRKVRWLGIAAAIRRYRRFPIYSTWADLFNTMGSKLPSLLFATLFSPAIAGIYMLTHRVLAMPMRLIGEAIGKVFFASAADARRSAKLDRLVVQVHAKLAQIAMPPALILLLVGPELFSLTFGSAWRQAGEFAQWMVPWVYLVFVTSPLSTLFSVMEQQAHGLMFQIVLLMIRIIALLIGAWKGDAIFAVALFALGSAACWFGLLVWVVRASGNDGWNVLLMPTSIALLWSMFLVSPLWVIRLVPENTQLWLISLGMTALLVTGRYMALLRKSW